MSSTTPDPSENQELPRTDTQTQWESIGRELLRSRLEHIGETVLRDAFRQAAVDSETVNNYENRTCRRYETRWKKPIDFSRTWHVQPLRRLPVQTRGNSSMRPQNSSTSRKQQNDESRNKPPVHGWLDSE
jgi:hypothetical protein